MPLLTSTEGVCGTCVLTSLELMCGGFEVVQHSLFSGLTGRTSVLFVLLQYMIFFPLLIPSASS